MRTDADDPARVRDPTIELLLSHTATLTDEWRSSARPVDNGLRASTRSDQRRVVPSDRTGVRLCVSDVDHPISYNQQVTPGTSATRIPQSCRALSTSRSDAGRAGDSCESEVTSAPRFGVRLSNGGFPASARRGALDPHGTWRGGANSGQHSGASPTCHSQLLFRIMAKQAGLDPSEAKLTQRRGRWSWRSAGR